MFETIPNFGTITIFSRKRPRVLILMQILSVKNKEMILQPWKMVEVGADPSYR